MLVGLGWGLGLEGRGLINVTQGLRDNTILEEKSGSVKTIARVLFSLVRYVG